jgi:hypothetical protein
MDKNKMGLKEELKELIPSDPPPKDYDPNIYRKSAAFAAGQHEEFKSPYKDTSKMETV